MKFVGMKYWPYLIAKSAAFMGKSILGFDHVCVGKRTLREIAGLVPFCSRGSIKDLMSNRHYGVLANVIVLFLGQLTADFSKHFLRVQH